MLVRYRVAAVVIAARGFGAAIVAVRAAATPRARSSWWAVSSPDRTDYTSPCSNSASRRFQRRERDFARRGRCRPALFPL